ncbi:MAG: hypothetical protein ACR2PK_08050 [Acidimicrobiales bacterium]
MSLTRDLCHGTVDHISSSLGLEEQLNDDLVSAMDGSPVGAHRILGGDSATVVYVGMTVEAFGLDSHMMFAFTPPESPVPHFTLDAVLAGPHYAFHLDLIPRVDPGANLAYLDHCFVPLTAAHDEALELEGLSPAHLSPRQWQLMSAWMLAHRADEAGFASIVPTVTRYRDHWLQLVASGVPDAAVNTSSDQLKARDAANRAAIFNPDVDPVWARVDQLLGQEVSQRIRLSLEHAGRGLQAI